MSEIEIIANVYRKAFEELVIGMEDTLQLLKLDVSERERINRAYNVGFFVLHEKRFAFKNAGLPWPVNPSSKQQEASTNER